MNKTQNQQHKTLFPPPYLMAQQRQIGVIIVFVISVATCEVTVNGPLLPYSEGYSCKLRKRLVTAELV